MGDWDAYLPQQSASLRWHPEQRAYRVFWLCYHRCRSERAFGFLARFRSRSLKSHGKNGPNRNGRGSAKLRLRAILSPALARRRVYEVRSAPANPFDNTEKSVPVRAVSLVRNVDNGGGDGTEVQPSPMRKILKSNAQTLAVGPPSLAEKPLPGALDIEAVGPRADRPVATRRACRISALPRKVAPQGAACAAKLKAAPPPDPPSRRDVRTGNRQARASRPRWPENLIAGPCG